MFHIEVREGPLLLLATISGKQGRRGTPLMMNFMNSKAVESP